MDHRRGTHACPRCGQETQGAYSEGGLRWAICEDCMARERQEAKGAKSVKSAEEGDGNGQ